MPTPHICTAGNPQLGTETTDGSRIDGPAVVFEPAALHYWLREPDDDYGTRAEQLGIDKSFSRDHGGLLGGLDDLLAALTDDQTQTAWRLRPGVTYAGLFRTHDGDGCDGAIIVVDLDSGQRLASLHHEPRDFASRDSHSIQAAVEALRSLAATANHIVDQHRHAMDDEQPDRPCCPGDLRAALNAMADDILTVTNAGDEGLRDAMNLAVNATLMYLEHGWLTEDPAVARDRLEQIATSNYGEDLDTILGWIDAGIR